MAYDYEFLLRVRAPRPTVFERLLRIEHLARWFCGWCRIEPKVGGKFQFGGETCLVLPEGRGWETTIDQGETLRRFAFTWPIRGAATRVSYELADGEGDSTLVTVRHVGLPTNVSTAGTIQDAWRTCLGNLKSIAEGRSDSVRPDHAAPGAGELRISNLIDAEPGRLFAALTVPAQLDAWSTGGVPAGTAAVDPRVGGVYRLGRGDRPGSITALERDARLVLEWPEETYSTEVEIALEPKSSGTAVYLRKSGYPDGERDAILRDRGAWSDRLVCLKNFIEGGDAGFANAYDAQMREA